MGNTGFDMEKYIKEMVDKAVEEAVGNLTTNSVSVDADGLQVNGLDVQGIAEAQPLLDMEELAEVITDSVREGVTQALEEQQKAFFKKMRSSGSGGFGFGTL